MRSEGISAAVARQEWLNPVEEALQKAVQGLFHRGTAARKTKNFLHGTWIKEPLHVILTDIPLGSWTAAVICDTLESLTGNDALGDAARYAITIGLVGAAGAAVTGLTDWSDVDEPARRIGLVHAALNIAGVSFFAGSLLARRNSTARGKALAALGFACSASAAYFGGKLVYEQGIGVDHTLGQKLPADFVPVLPESALVENQPRRVEHEGVPILLIRRNERIFALPATCSHLGGPLDEGTFEGNSVQCPWHGSRFSLEYGTVLDGPAVHSIPCLEVRVRKGQVEVRERRPDERAERVGSGEPPAAERTGTMG
jgi:nitrite reductase/ring-hydroxylating ferredoxin subunit/uncharacterized membrane protein